VSVQRSPQALVPLLLVAVVSACGGSGPEARAPEEPRAVAVAALEMSPRDLTLALDVTGHIEPIREYRVASRMAGILRDVRVEEGRRVAAGAVLARFDLAEQQAELSRARTVLDHAEAQYRRAREMHARELLSEVDYENSRAEVALAASEVRLWEARTALGTVRAPAAGVITQKFVESGMAVTSGESLFVLADLSTLVVRVGLSDVHVPHLSAGQPASVLVEGPDAERWPASVRRVFPSADPDTRLRTVEFALERQPGRTPPPPGALARVLVDLDERPGALAVPNEALLASAGGTPFVYVIEDDRLVRREVVTGVSRGDWTEVLEGLEPGELVVGSNPARLGEGMRVRVTERVTPGGGAS
jgi:membrane fusion protein, multidrug efflux system